MIDGTLSAIALGWLGFSAAALSPGPNMIAVAARALGGGRAAALRVAFGISIGAFLWAVLSVAGLARVFERYPWSLPLLAVVGGLYLCWLGFKGLRSAWRGGQAVIDASAATGGRWTDVAHGLAVTSSNPKVALMWASLATLVGPAIDGPGQALVFALGSGVLGYAIYGGYGMVFSSGGVRSLYDSFGRTADGLFGILFSALGLSLLMRVA